MEGQFMWWRDLLLIIVPGFISIGGLLLIIKEYFKSVSHAKLTELSIQQKQTTLPMKLQAYERLCLMLERIKVNHLWYRLNTPGSDLMMMPRTMALAIQQEFEHNLSQQIYVSENLWKIIISAKEQHQMGITLIQSENEDELKRALFEMDEKRFIDIALSAIRHEIQLFL